MSCCPEGSWAELKEDYITIGTEIQLDGIKIYTVGSGEKCIIYNHDIFGWMPSTCGRTRAICDFLAKNGYFVILPDYFEGDVSFIIFIKQVATIRYSASESF